MSHSIGRIVPVSGTPRIGPDGGPTPTPPVWEFPFTPDPAVEGGTARFVILHFKDMVFPAGARLEVDVRYGTDVFTVDGEAHTRPIDVVPGPISIKYFGNGGATGGVTFDEYASGELKTTGPGLPGTDNGRQTNPDVFLEFLKPDGTYQEPIYETRGQCGGTFDWENVVCNLTAAEEAAARATCLLVMRDSALELSTCTGTLIGPDLVICAEHCAADPSELEARSGSVTFDFQTECDGSKPNPYNPVFHKIKRVVRRGILFDPAPSDADIGKDWAVLQIETPPGGLGITPRTLRATGPMAGEKVFGIHHPNGSVKKIQRFTLPANSVHHLPIDVCGGSSGSALFDVNGNIIGAAAHGGESGVTKCNIAYASAKDVLNELATPPAPPKPYDVMLVMDRSGSMASPGTSPTTPGTTKMSDAHEAANLFIDLVRSGGGDQLGLVSFSDKAKRPPEVGLGTMTNAHRSALHTAVGNLNPDTTTSIGDGLKAAMETLTPGAHQRAILLMTDGLQNTDPSIEEGESTLGDTQLFIVGFGTDGDLDGPRMTTLARDHNGIFNRAHDGLVLKKFFSLCFGDIFESGALADPTHFLRASENVGKSVPFRVCEEERVTAILGWNDPSQTLRLDVKTPGGSAIHAATPGVESRSGNTWQFLRVELPHGGERAGTWSWQVSRVIGGGEFPPEQHDVRYFVTVIAKGGPFFRRFSAKKRYYTGDPVNPRVMLRYANSTAPNGTVMLEIEAPDAAIGRLVSDAKLSPPQVSGDGVDAFHATLQKVESAQGPLATRTLTVPLFDDGDHDDGAFERDGIFGNVLTDLTRYEGTYNFRAMATFGDGCTATRETFWSITVDPSIDPSRTTVEVVPGGIRITPHDGYGNPLGPGRGDHFTVSGFPGVTVTGPAIDNGDGSYTVPATWDPNVPPGIVVSQPDKPGVPLTPPATSTPGCAESLWLWILLGLFFVVIIVLLVILFLK